MFDKLTLVASLLTDLAKLAALVIVAFAALAVVHAGHDLHQISVDNHHSVQQGNSPYTAPWVNTIPHDGGPALQ